MPTGIKDKSLSSISVKKIDLLQTRMDLYVDKIGKMSSGTARDFLKSKLRADYISLKDIIQKNSIAESDSEQYEIIDTRTGTKVAGPYSSLKRASNAAEKRNQEFGSHRYTYRSVKKLTEAVHKLPLTPEDFNMVKRLMGKPIPAIIAPIYIMEIIDDDELTDQFKSLEITDPARDVRPLIVEWLRRVMPDQMYHFGQALPNEQIKTGSLSPIHGYDSHSYKGTNDPITGNAYGSR